MIYLRQDIPLKKKMTRYVMYLVNQPAFNLFVIQGFGDDVFFYLIKSVHNRPYGFPHAVVAMGCSVPLVF